MMEFSNSVFQAFVDSFKEAICPIYIYRVARRYYIMPHEVRHKNELSHYIYSATQAECVEAWLLGAISHANGIVGKEATNEHG